MEERSFPGEFPSVDPTIPARGTEITPVNGNNDTGTRSCYTQIFALNSLNILLALIGLAGNATVLWLLGFRMRRNAFSVYILNLAGADFLFLCLQIIYILERVTDLSHFTHIPLYFHIISNFAYLTGLSLLSAISTERCLSVLWPIWYRCHRPRHTSAAVCGLLWTLSLVLCFLEGNACGLFLTYSYHDFCKTFDFITVAWLIASFVVLCGSSLALLLRIFCGSRRVPVTRLYVTLVLTVLVFLLLGLPFGIFWSLLAWFNTTYQIIPCGPYPVTLVLSSANSCANPIIYFFIGSFRHPRFQRRSLKLILQRAIQDTPEEGECGHRGSSGNSRELVTVFSRH